MNIATRIGELLFEHECVVLPGFGGFITNDKPAVVNRVTHQFKPPYREILFNVQLTANDGLLAKYISGQEAVSYLEAKKQLTEFVNWCRSELDAGRQVEFSQIGKLSIDNSGNIVFEQDHQVNYNTDAFGLSSLVSPAIQRASQEEKIKGMIFPGAKAGKRTDRKPAVVAVDKENKPKSLVYRFPLAIAGLLLLVILITSLFMPQQSALISIAGLFPSSSNETLTEKNPEQIPEKNVPSGEVLPLSGPNEEVAVTEPETVNENVEENNLPDKHLVEADIIPEKNNPEIAEPLPDKTALSPAKNLSKIQSRGPIYYIIAGSFAKEENANKLIVQLAQKGYAAVVADTNKNGMYRVAYVGFSGKAEAKQQLFAIRQEENAEAWLLRK